MSKLSKEEKEQLQELLNYPQQYSGLIVHNLMQAALNILVKRELARSKSNVKRKRQAKKA